MSWTRPPIASVRSRLFESPSSSPTHGEQRDAAGVPLGVFVLLGERDREGADLRAEEDVLGLHELGTREIAGERPALRGAREIDRDGDADEQDPVQLHLVADPPAELLPGHRQGGHERGREPRDADDHEQIEEPVREEESAEGADADDAEGDQPDCEERVRLRAAGLGDRRHEAGPDERGQAECEHRHDEHGLEHEERDEVAQHARKREHRRGEDDSADRQGDAARDCDDAVPADEDSGRRQTMQREQARHGGERRADDHRAGVAAPRTEPGERPGGERGGECAEPDRVEVERRREPDVDVPDRHVEDRGHERRDEPGDEQEGTSTVSQPAIHTAVIGLRGSQP